jgi:hypothetical protein
LILKLLPNLLSRTGFVRKSADQQRAGIADAGRKRQIKRREAPGTDEAADLTGRADLDDMITECSQT